MFKIFLKYLFYGVWWGCFGFVGICLIMDRTNAAALQYIFEDFTRQALGAVLVGIGSYTTAFVYEIERLRFELQVAIHFAVGLGVFFGVAATLGWLPSESPAAVALYLVLGVVIFTAIWSCHYLYGKHVARKINDKIKQKQSGQ